MSEAQAISDALQEQLGGSENKPPRVRVQKRVEVEFFMPAGVDLDRSVTDETGRVVWVLMLTPEDVSEVCCVFDEVSMQLGAVVEESKLP